MKNFLGVLLLVLCLLSPQLVAADSNPYVLAGGGVTAAAYPTWGAEVDRWNELGSGGTTDITLTGGILQGDTVILAMGWINAGQTLTSIADDRSNTYTIHTNYAVNAGAEKIAIATAYVTTALQIGDKITITWGSAAYSYRSGLVGYATNVAASSPADQVESGATSYGSSVSANGDGNTTATHTLLFGYVFINDEINTYGSGNWTTTSGGLHSEPGARYSYYIYSEESTAGEKNPGGTLSGNTRWGAVWVALK